MVRIQGVNSLTELYKILQEKGISESDFGNYANQFLEAKARRCLVPLSGSFELTPLCNLDCKMCYAHLSTEQFNTNNHLSVKQWITLIEQAHAEGMLNATLTGGECLIYPGFDELYLYLYGLGIRPGIMSNGVLMDENRIKILKRYPPKMIQISLYGSSEEAYEKVTGHRAFRTVYHNLYLLRKEGLPVKITITPNEYMENDIDAFFRIVETLDIPYNINANLIPPRKNTGRIVKDLPVDKYIEIYKAKSCMHFENDSYSDSQELQKGHQKSYNSYGLECGAGRSAFTIMYDGSMCPCSSLDEMIVKPLDIGFKKAWNQLNDLANAYPLPQECNGCVLYDRCLHCAAMHKNAPLTGHCDPRICERTKKLIHAGLIPGTDSDGIIC